MLRPEFQRRGGIKLWNGNLHSFYIFSTLTASLVLLLQPELDYFISGVHSKLVQVEDVLATVSEGLEEVLLLPRLAAVLLLLLEGDDDLAVPDDENDDDYNEHDHEFRTLAEDTAAKIRHFCVRPRKIS